MQTICKCRIPQFLFAFMICHGLAGFIFSGVVPGRWEKLAAEPVGAEIRIFFKSGEQLEGAIQEVAADHLEVLAGDGRQILAQKSDIIRIISARRHDRLRNGALTGAAIGAGIGLLSLIYAVSEQGTNDTDAWGTGGVITMIGFGSGLFIGAGVDAALKGDLVLYQAP